MQGRATALRKPRYSLATEFGASDRFAGIRAGLLSLRATVRRASGTAAALQPFSMSCVIHEDATHRFRCGGRFGVYLSLISTIAQSLMGRPRLCSLTAR